MFLVSVVFVNLMLPSVSAQDSINAREGFDVGYNLGVAIAISFTILSSFILIINCIHFAYIRKRR